MGLSVLTAGNRMALRRKFKGRKNYCGECLREIDGQYPDIRHKEDFTPMCKARPIVPMGGEEIKFRVDTETSDRIAASGLDPRCHEYWEVHPAANGNKCWKSWKGKPVEPAVKQYNPQSNTFWCANCGGYRTWTHTCSLAK